MPSLSFLYALQGGAGAAGGNLGTIRDRHDEERRRREDRTYRERGDVLQLLGSGRYRLRNTARDLGLEQAGIDDVEAVPQADLDEQALGLVRGKARIEREEGPWQPRSMSEWIRARTAHSAAVRRSDPTLQATREALADQRKQANRNRVIANVVSAAEARLRAGNVSATERARFRGYAPGKAPSPELIVAAATNILGGDPRYRPLFDRGEITRDDIWAAVQSRKKPTKSEIEADLLRQYTEAEDEPSIDTDDTGDDVDDTPTGSGAPEKSVVPSQAAYDALRRGGANRPAMSKEEIAERYDLGQGIRAW